MQGGYLGNDASRKWGWGTGHRKVLFGWEKLVNDQIVMKRLQQRKVTNPERAQANGIGRPMDLEQRQVNHGSGRRERQ